MKKQCTAVLLLFLAGLPLLTRAQSFSFRYDQRPSISVGGKILPNAWAGGLDGGQFNTMRLNTDDRDDLVVFDRASGRVSTFIATASGWQHAPEYELTFPAMQNWLVLADYDGDGRKDLFTHTPAGVRVLRNTSAAGQVSWQLATWPLKTEGLSDQQALYVAPVDIPAFTDYDNDGDLDVLAFEVSGNYIIYYQNLSKEKGAVTPGLDFKRIGYCWGNFTATHECNVFTFGVNCSNAGGRVGTQTTNPNARPMHSGNTLTILDADGDGRKDVLFGHVSCDNLALLRNAGANSEKASFTSVEGNFPKQNPINFVTFPAAFLEDVDGDGQRDLIASPNTGSSDATGIDMRASNWFYRNAGTNAAPNFQLAQKNFLQDNMVDLGVYASPTLGDLDGDGDADLLVGNYGVQDGQGARGSLAYFENKGTSTDPIFDLVNADYLQIAQTGSPSLSTLQPQLVDFDGNGSLDLILTGTTTRGATEIRLYTNTAGRTQPVRFGSAQLLPVPDRMGGAERPTVVDVDRDGKLDILVGKSSGAIEYHRNTGTVAAPQFLLQNQAFGGIGVNLLLRSPTIVVADINGDDRPEMLTGTADGKLKLYRFPETPNQPLTLLDSLVSVGIPGAGLAATMADLNGDKLPDLVLGTQAGGLRYLRNTSEKVIITATEQEEPLAPWAFPNPTERYVTLRPPQDGQAEVINLSGQTALPGVWVRAHNDTTLDLGQLPDGVYLIRLTSDSRAVRTQKVVLWK